MVYLLDTNICIHLRRGHAGIARRLASSDAGGVMSVITYGELLFGAERSLNSAARANIERLAECVRVEELPSAAAHHYGHVRQVLASKGQIIGQNDLWIAAHALAGDFILVTDNVGEFQRVPGLQLENWFREAD